MELPVRCQAVNDWLENPRVGDLPECRLWWCSLHPEAVAQECPSYAVAGLNAFSRHAVAQ